MRSVFWYDKPLRLNKPIAPHLIAMNPVGSDNLGWVKVTGGDHDPLCAAMREACSNPRATYAEMETLLRRLAKSYGAEVHRRGGIAPAIKWEHATAMKANFLEVAGLDPGLNSKWPARIRPYLKEMWITQLVDRCTSWGLNPRVDTEPLQLEHFHPRKFTDSSMRDLMILIFAHTIILRPPHDLEDIAAKTRELQDIVNAWDRPPDYKIQIVKPPDQLYQVHLWWKAHLNEDGLLVSHVQGKTQ